MLGSDFYILLFHHPKAWSHENFWTFQEIAGRGTNNKQANGKSKAFLKNPFLRLNKKSSKCRDHPQIHPNQSINQSTNQPSNQSINQPINQSINQSINQISITRCFPSFSFHVWPPIFLNFSGAPVDSARCSLTDPIGHQHVLLASRECTLCTLGCGSLPYLSFT